MALSSVSVAPVTSRPSYVPGAGDDVIDVLSLGPPFPYIIPSFDVLRVELRQMKVAVVMGGVDTNYDLFIRNQPSLSPTYPARMTVKGIPCNRCECWVGVELAAPYKFIYII